MSDFLKSLIKDVLIAVVLAAILLCIIRPTMVRQTSMMDTLHNNDYLIMYKLAYRKADPERGDIIVFQSSMRDEKGNDKLLIKRVIGLPGDTITIEDGEVYINGELYPEDYTKDGYTPGDIKDLTVPDGQFFVMGDNRVSSIDSRSEEVGLVSKSQIKGKTVLRLYPFSQIQRF